MYKVCPLDVILKLLKISYQSLDFLSPGGREFYMCRDIDTVLKYLGEKPPTREHPMMTFVIVEVISLCQDALTKGLNNNAEVNNVA